MRISLAGVALVCVVSLMGCGTKFSFRGNQSATTAGNTVYPYGFNGRVRALDGSALTNFAVTLLKSDPSINTVVNSLGSADGIFHVSRLASSGSSALSLPALITAPGFEPLVQNLQVAPNCQGAGCVSNLLDIVLKPIAASLASGLKPADFSPDQVTQQLLQNGAASVFNGLVKDGKLDPTIQSLLSQANVKDPFSNILVMLNGNSGNQTADVVTTLLGALNQGNSAKGNPAAIISAIVPILLATSSPQGGALAAVQVLLPYFSQLLPQLTSGQGGVLGQILAGFLNPTAPGAIDLTKLFQNNGKNSAQIAMGTILPIVSGILGQVSGGKTNADPFLSIISGILKDPNGLANLFNPGKSQQDQLNAILSLVTPLIQGIGGSNGAQIAALFNQLVQQGGISGLKNLNGGNAGQFAQLLPFLEPLIGGLNGGNGAQVAAMIAPFLSGSDPASAIASLLTQLGQSQGSSQLGTLIPGLASMLQQAVPGKQVLGAQLLQGWLNSEFQNLKVTQDLQNVPAVVVSGQAQDILKLAQLPNVQKLISLK